MKERGLTLTPEIGPDDSYVLKKLYKRMYIKTLDLN